MAADSEQGRLASAVTRAKGTLGEGMDKLTGRAFRLQFESFTEAVTTAVLGIHRDTKDAAAAIQTLRGRVTAAEGELARHQTLLGAVPDLQAHAADLKASVPALEKRVAELEDELARQRFSPQPSSTPTQRLSVAALVVSIAALATAIATILIR